ncbi:MAG: hypothetical protein FWG16_02270 [Micrococcales bacterium]|nr:hypothetical protein [Micrococcales bacterium]
MTDGWDEALAQLLQDQGHDADPAGGLEGPAGEPQPVQVAALFVPPMRPELLAWALHQLGVGGHCLKAGTEVVAFLDDADEAAWLEAASKVSAAFARGPIVAVRRGASQNPGASDIQAFVYHDGQQTAPLPPGLLLAHLPDPIEDYFLDPEGEAALLADAVVAGSEVVAPSKRSLRFYWRPGVLGKAGATGAESGSGSGADDRPESGVDGVAGAESGAVSGADDRPESGVAGATEAAE